MLPVSSAYYLAGDPSSLPAISALLGALSPHATGLSVHWVVGSTASTDTLLQQFHAMTRYIDANSAFF
ncbi:MAG: hypothetical protein ACR5LC_08705 [Symbiopectobacterium sp.]|uniref:hypothetical protein n=1 Tax=Symbiopectobacterium sp. TaxID=2952789 RepID=UPI003F37EC38